MIDCVIFAGGSFDINDVDIEIAANSCRNVIKMLKG